MGQLVEREVRSLLGEPEEPEATVARLQAESMAQFHEQMAAAMDQVTAVFQAHLEGTHLQRERREAARRATTLRQALHQCARATRPDPQSGQPLSRYLRGLGDYFQQFEGEGALAEAVRRKLRPPRLKVQLKPEVLAELVLRYVTISREGQGGDEGESEEEVEEEYLGKAKTGLEKKLEEELKEQEGAIVALHEKIHSEQERFGEAVRKLEAEAQARQHDAVAAAEHKAQEQAAAAKLQAEQQQEKAIRQEQHARQAERKDLQAALAALEKKIAELEAGAPAAAGVPQPPPPNPEVRLAYQQKQQQQPAPAV